MGALLAAETNKRETLPKTALAVLITVLLYWMTHAYAESLGRRVPNETTWHPRQFLDALTSEWAIVRGSSIPLFAVLFSWLAGASVGDGTFAGLLTAAVLVALLELLAGIRSHQGRTAITFQTVGGVILGLAILALRVLLH